MTLQLEQKKTTLLFIGHGTAILLSLVLMGFSLYALAGLNQISGTLYQHPFLVNTASQEAEINVLGIRKNMLQIVTGAGSLEQNKQEVESLVAQLHKNIQLIEEFFQGDISRVNQIEPLIAQWEKERTLVFNLVNDKQHAQATAWVNTTGMDITGKIIEQLNYIQAYSKDRAAALIHESDQKLHTEQDLMSLLFGLLTLIVMTTAYTTRRFILQFWQLAKTEELLVNDMTVRKRAEEQLRSTSLYMRSLIETSLDPLMTISTDGKITDVNEATIQATGVPRNQLIRSEFSSYFTEPDKARAAYKAAFAKGAIRDYPLTMKHVSGKITEVLYNASLYRNEKGEVMGVFAAARDITKLKKTEEELHIYHEHLEELVEERTTQLETANKDMESFAYSVSHDLRVPLRAIDGFSRILAEDYPEKLDTEGKRLISVVRDNTMRMSKLIDDILAFSRVGRKELAAEKVDMIALVNEVSTELAPSWTGRDVKIEVGALPPTQGDAAMLRQVWVNLLSNAIKFTRPQPNAVIKVGGDTKENQTIYYVKDNGVGFDMKYIERLFGVFQRLHGIEEFEGTGIGLAIVKRIITRHGGRVWAEGKSGKVRRFISRCQRKRPSYNIVWEIMNEQPSTLDPNKGTPS